ncbi:alpha carbonic anhydrase 7-like [Phalaenopsis equestris]|uniref:alpha carbonic anhydrase 7-like n=1 Tax=Phalaenopsis equestris TaxID=78828 RepID=UPI0009E4AA44|nr:alpha carbonic anhydrase 7-like [Phalaenopsis equestris]
MERFKQLVLIIAIMAFLYIDHDAMAYEHVEFSYTVGAWNGPDHWGDIRKDWETCKIGHSQSPVSIYDEKTEFVYQPEDLKWIYHPEKAVMKNLGHNIAIQWEDVVGAVWINKTEYPLKQVHFHTPSENTLNGKKFDLEVHLLHRRTNDHQMAMVSLLYEVGAPDPFFTKVEKHIRAISKKIDATADIGNIDPMEVIRKFGKHYYRLKGSITIPPCTEGVTWTIDKKIRTISIEQLNLLKDAAIPGYAKNARPVQPLNDRVVQLFV